MCNSWWYHILVNGKEITAGDLFVSFVYELAQPYPYDPKIVDCLVLPGWQVLDGKARLLWGQIARLIAEIIR